VTRLSAQILDAYGVSMVLIPGGAFRMGSDAGGDESPIHSVFLETYYIDQYEVTNAHYAACVDAGVCEEVNPSELRDPEFAGFPVRYVRWEQAVTYCEWRGGFLPTEAQWEKAARGGLDSMEYPWGDEPGGCEPGAANGAQYAACGASTVAVGSFAPNGYGLYDVVGNVWEWTADWYDRSYYGESPESNPPGPEFGTLRVRRGGSWGFNDDYLRVANRTSVEPVGYADIGVRCAAFP
jgi:formylglycine-generating enzyme required for sulfatase activity